MSAPAPRRAFLPAATALVVGAGLALRLFDLTAGTFGLDEAYTALLARPPVTRILALAATDANPPLTSLVYRAWTALFGHGELAWESLAALAGTVTIPLFGRLVGRVEGRAALPAMLLLAVSPLHVALSQTVRSYALALLAATVAALGVVRAATSPTDRAAPWLVASGSLALVYTHYYGALVVAALFVGWWIAVPADRLRAAGLAAAVGLASLPAAWWLYRQTTEYRSFDWIPPAGGDPAEILLHLGGGAAGAVALVAASLAGAWRAWREPSLAPGANVFAAWAVVPWAVAALVSGLLTPILHPRYSALWLLPFLALAALGIAGTGPRARALALGLFVAAAVPGLVAHHGAIRAGAPRQELFDAVAAAWRDGDVILHLDKSTWAPSVVHHRHRLPERLLAGGPGSNVLRYWLDRPAEVEIDDLEGFARVWVIAGDTDASPLRQTERALRDRGWQPVHRAGDARLGLWLAPSRL